MDDCIARIAACTENTAGLVAEAQWADAFHALSLESSWLKDKTFSPGRWAIGYQYLYALYWFLEKMEPECVLDLGLGQSTRIIAQYAAANPKVRHIVVESSQEWIKFFKNSCFALPSNTTIIHCPYGTETFKGVNDVRVYENFVSLLQNYKFDLVSIDAPHSGDMMEFGRVDTIKLIPDRLSKRYAILFDDTGRKADNAGFRALVDELMVNRFTAQIGCFHGLKRSSVVVSEDLQSLLSNASRRLDPSDPSWRRKFAGTEVEGLDTAPTARAQIRRRCEVKAAKQEIANLKKRLAVADAAIEKRDRWLEDRSSKLAASQESILRLREACQRDVSILKERLAVADAAIAKRDQWQEAQASKLAALQESMLRLRESYKRDVSKLKERLAVADAAIAKRDRWLEDRSSKLAVSQASVQRLREAYQRDVSMLKGKLASKDAEVAKRRRLIEEIVSACGMK